MSRERGAFLLLVLSVFALILHCNHDSPSQYAGGSSGTEVSVLSGIVLNPDSTPAVNAIVRIRPADYLCDSAFSSEYLSSHFLIDTVTGPDGSFNVDQITPGSYRIEVSSGDSLAVMIEVDLDSTENRHNLLENVLLPMAEIEVKVKIKSNDKSLGRLQIYGLEREVYSDSDGFFSVRVPYGAHIIHLGAVSADSFRPYNPEMGYLDVKLNMGVGEKRDLGTFNLVPQPMKPCYDGHCDSITINKILDTLGLEHFLIDSVCSWRNGRIDSISFRGRDLEFIPWDIVKLMRVTALDLGRCGLQLISGDITIMRNITSLYLDSNQLSQLPQGIGNLINCRVLNLSGNNLKSLPRSITDLSPKIFLDLSGNSLCQTDQELGEWADRYDQDWRGAQKCP